MPGQDVDESLHRQLCLWIGHASGPQRVVVESPTRRRTARVRVWLKGPGRLSWIEGIALVALGRKGRPVEPAALVNQPKCAVRAGGIRPIIDDVRKVPVL